MDKPYIGYQFGKLPSVVHLRTKQLRDQADKLLTLHDDIAELKAVHDAGGGLDDETPSRKVNAHIGLELLGGWVYDRGL